MASWSIPALCPLLLLLLLLLKPFSPASLRDQLVRRTSRWRTRMALDQQRRPSPQPASKGIPDDRREKDFLWSELPDPG